MNAVDGAVKFLDVAVAVKLEVDVGIGPIVAVQVEEPISAAQQ